MSGEAALSVEELAHRAGVSVRTVRYYISQGLLPGPANRGKYASYDEDHLARLRLIRRLVDQHVPLAELRERLAHLTSEEVRTLLGDEVRRSHAMEQTRSAASPRDYVSGLLARARSTPPAPPPPRQPAQPDDASWHSAPPNRELAERASETLQPEPLQRWELAPGVELFVRTSAARQHAHLIELLLECARNELGRDAK